MAEDRTLARLTELGIDLARAFHPPAGNYRNVAIVDGLAFVAGHGPLLDGAPQYRGKVPSQVSVEDAYEAARLTAVNCLASLHDALGSLDRIVRCVKVLGMVNADADFADHPAVINGASDVLLEVLGDRGVHARSAVGMGSLPFGIPVEVEMVVVVDGAVGAG